MQSNIEYSAHFMS